jgi:predicted nucleic acid-binding protein
LSIYIDTSLLVSLYSPDANSVAAARTIQASSGHRFITTFGELEFLNALELRVFRKESSLAQTRAARDDFVKDLRDGVFQLRGLSDQIFDRARQLAQQTTCKLGTRTADLLHVAAAVELGADYLYTFDLPQRKLAGALRLKVN